jgi:hypothetical protein
MLDALVKAVHHYLDKQDEPFVKNLFDRLKEISSGKIRTDGLHQALFELGVRGEAEDLMVVNDLDKTGGLDYEEFKRAVAQPPTQLEQWAGMLPLAGLLASSLPISCGQGDQPLRDFSRLREDEIYDAVEAFREGLTRLLMESKTKLRQIFEAADEKAIQAANDSARGVSAVTKFKTFKMSTGKVAEYYSGLSGRIGKFHWTWVEKQH